MKKSNSSFILFMIVMLFATTINAQYKLGINNFWVYSSDSQEWKISIVDTAVLFDSVLYYETYEQREWLSKSIYNTQENGDTNQYFIRLREDNLFEKIIVYNAITDTVIQPYIYKENAQIGEKWICRISDEGTDYDTIWAEVVDVFSGYQFGEWRTIKKVTYWTGLNDHSKYFCDDFGELSEEGFNYWHGLKGCYIDGIAYGDTSFTTVGIENKKNQIIDYQLKQNYPNPFNPITTISYSLPKSGFVQLKVYDMLGCEIVILVDEEQSIGNYRLGFNASKLSSGVYFYRLQSGNFKETKKLVLLR